jgi:MinD superfamily P-loop ATPase
MGAAIRHNVAHQLRNPSRYRPRVESDACTGCQTCAERCFFGAIEMVKVPGTKKLKASVIEEKCMGCGLCVIGCAQKAMIFDLVKPPEYLAIDREEHLPPPSAETMAVWGRFASA